MKQIALFFLFVILSAIAQPTPADNATMAFEAKVTEERLDATEKEFVRVGKADFLLREVQMIARHLFDKKGTTADSLLDGNISNLEYEGIKIDETDPFNTVVTDYLTLQNGELYEFKYEGFGIGNKLFIASEVAQMHKTIKKGLSLEAKFARVPDKASRFIRALDIQAGKIEGMSSTWIPRFEYQMGFESESLMRRVLKKTVSIEVNFVPHNGEMSFLLNDFRVMYHLDNGSLVELYVESMPLGVLIE
jgi:hypothetical protein